MVEEHARVREEEGREKRERARLQASLTDSGELPGRVDARGPVRYYGYAYRECIVATSCL